MVEVLALLIKLGKIKLSILHFAMMMIKMLLEYLLLILLQKDSLLLVLTHVFHLLCFHFLRIRLRNKNVTQMIHMVVEGATCVVALVQEAVVVHAR